MTRAKAAPCARENEDAADLGIGGHGHAQEAAAVRLEQGEDVPDRLVPETQAAPLLVGQPLGRDVRRIERGQVEPAAGDRLEAEIVVAVAAEALELFAGAVVHGFRPKKKSEGVAGRGRFGEEEGDVAVEECPELLQRRKARRALVGFEEGNVLRGQPDGPGERALGQPDRFAGFPELVADESIHGDAPPGASGD